MINKYKFRKYKKKYPKEFEKERKRLKKISPNSIIEHIGSTAVENLGGKGIIDILVSIPQKELQKIRRNLIEFGYIETITGGGRNRISFRRGSLFRKHKFHLHLTTKNSKVYKDAIKFRDSLSKDKRLREKYSKLKQEAVGLRKEKQDYRDFKDKFIKEALRK